MGKMYTLDHHLLVETPEIRLGDKIYPVDNRTKTVKSMMQLTKQENAADEDYMVRMNQAMEMALGKQAVQELDLENMRFPAYQKLFELVLAAATGDDPEKPAADDAGRFPAQ